MHQRREGATRLDAELRSLFRMPDQQSATALASGDPRETTQRDVQPRELNGMAEPEECRREFPEVPRHAGSPFGVGEHEFMNFSRLGFARIVGPTKGSAKEFRQQRKVA